jgi:anti-sigma factor RsiW
MRCDELQGLFDLYLDADLSEETAQKLTRHLMRCAACAYEMRTLEQTRAMVRDAIPQAEATPGFRERAAAHLLDAFADRLQPRSAPEESLQWALPFPREEPGS